MHKGEARSFQFAEENVGELEGFLERLRILGATPDELAAAREHWDDFDDEWTPEVRRDYVRQSDDVLRADLHAARREYLEGTTDPEVLEAADRDAEVEALAVEALEHNGYTVAKVLEWVGDDPARAEAMLAVERTRGDARKGVLEPLEALCQSS